MTDTIRLGRVAGIPVGIHWSALVVGIAVTVLLALQILPGADRSATSTDLWIAAGAGTLLFFVSLLAHEFGHAIMARRHDVGVAGLTLWVLGGMAKLTRQAPTPRAEFQIAIAGPAANAIGGLLFGGLAWLLYGNEYWLLGGAVCVWLAAVNVLLAVTNLAPGSPLDGGRVLAAFLWRRNGNAERSRLIAARLGLAMGLGIVILGLAEALWVGRISGYLTIAIGVFVAAAAKNDIAGAAVRARLDAMRLDALMVRHPVAVPDGSTAKQFLDWSNTQPIRSANPVVRWGNEPLGYLTSSMAAQVPEADRSWTTVGGIMLPAHLTPRAWDFESVATVLDRLDVSLPSVIVVHDPRTRQPLGTVSDDQIVALFAPPDWWGRDRTPPIAALPATAPALVGSR
ncbi:MAG: site-2 protease family protein [Acidimicrobiales bacterium]